MKNTQLTLLLIADRPPENDLDKIISTQNIDVICTLGDFTISDIRSLEHIDIPKLGVYGNHCSGTYFEPLGVTNMHLKTIEIEGVTFGGFEGSVRYKSNPEAIMYTQEEARQMLSNYSPVDVFLSHSPPEGINDGDDPAHVGFRALREYIDRNQPKYFFHGHTYPDESEEINEYQDTQIEYVFRDEVFTIKV